MCLEKVHYKAVTSNGHESPLEVPMNVSPAWLLLLSAFLPQSASNDTGVKMTIHFGMSGQPIEQTIYLRGDRKRTESRGSSGRVGSDGAKQVTYGPRLVLITRCDLGQIFELNLDDAQYVSTPYPPKPFTKKEIEARGLNRLNMSTSEKPTLRIETTTLDTGERKEISGHIARHIIMTRKQIPLEGSHSQPQDTVTDGWYIDFDQSLSCDRRPPKGTRAHSFGGVLVAGNQLMERPEFIDIGEAQTGFPLQQTMTSKTTYIGADGNTPILRTKPL